MKILAALDGRIRVTVPIDPRRTGAAAPQFPGSQTLRFRALRARRGSIQFPKAQTLTWRLGVDIGGTFTDFTLFDERGSEIALLKRLTTPTDPSIAVIEGTAALLRREDAPMAEVESIAHGTALVTNAAIERRGAKTCASPPP